MFEMNVVAQQNGQFYTDYVCRSVTDCLRDCQATGVSVKRGNTFNYSVACHDEMSQVLKEQVVSAVSNCLCLGYKHDYLSRKLFEQPNKTQKALVNLMCLFDNAKEKRLVAKQFDGNTLNIDATYHFRLKELVKKWEDVATLTNSYGDILSDNQTLIDFFKFLLRSIPFATNCLEASISQEQLTLFDCDKQAYCQIVQLPVPNSNTEDLLLFNLMCYRPRQLTLCEGTECLSQECIYLCKNLFCKN